MKVLPSISLTMLLGILYQIATEPLGINTVLLLGCLVLLGLSVITNRRLVKDVEDINKTLWGDKMTPGVLQQLAKIQKDVEEVQRWVHNSPFRREQ